MYSCNRCMYHTRIQSHSAGEVDILDGCAIIPSEYDIKNIMRKEGCRLGTVINNIIKDEMSKETRDISMTSLSDY